MIGNICGYNCEALTAAGWCLLGTCQMILSMLVTVEGLPLQAGLQVAAFQAVVSGHPRQRRAMIWARAKNEQFCRCVLELGLCIED